MNREDSGKLVMGCLLETKAATILQFLAGLRGTLFVTIEEGTSPPGSTIYDSRDGWFRAGASHFWTCGGGLLCLRGTHH